MEMRHGYSGSTEIRQRGKAILVVKGGWVIMGQEKKRCGRWRLEKSGSLAGDKYPLV